MAERITAGDQLTRILTLLPFAIRDPDCSFDHLEAQTGFTREQIVDDLTEVYTRSFYHPAGSADRTQVMIEPDSVYVWTTGDFQRPSRLGPAEVLALALGLRILAAEAGAERRAEILTFANGLESWLGREASSDMLERVEPEVERPAAEGIRSLLAACARDGEACEIEYLKAGAAAPETRRLDPYVLVAARGAWYVLGRCHDYDAIRSFRLDRVLAAGATGLRFEPPADFDPSLYLRDRRVFRAPDDVEVVVRYSARIARWITEKWPTEAQADGAVLVRHEVADPRWLVRHVLQYGAEAEVLEPASYRALVLESLSAVAEASSC